MLPDLVVAGIAENLVDGIEELALLFIPEQLNQSCKNFKPTLKTWFPNEHKQPLSVQGLWELNTI